MDTNTSENSSEIDIKELLEEVYNKTYDYISGYYVTKNEDNFNSENNYIQTLISDIGNVYISYFEKIKTDNNLATISSKDLINSFIETSVKSDNSLIRKFEIKEVDNESNRKRRSVLFEDILASLPEKYTRELSLYYLQKLDINEISKATYKTEKEVKEDLKKSLLYIISTHGKGFVENRLEDNVFEENLSKIKYFEWLIIGEERDIILENIKQSLNIKIEKSRDIKLARQRMVLALDFEDDEDVNENVDKDKVEELKEIEELPTGDIIDELELEEVIDDIENEIIEEISEKINTDKKRKNPYIIVTLIFLVIVIIIIVVKMFMQR
jgi:hypothetical protein